MPEWSADVTVDEPLVRALIAGQFPELAPLPVRRLAEGWDNAVWLVGERWAFRFPRREIALPGFERELAALPRLAPALPLPVPVPVFTGRPAVAGFLRALHGAALDGLPVDPNRRADMPYRTAMTRESFAQLGLEPIIDWGDVCRGDPSVDLSLLWSFFPPGARPAFLAAYGPVSDAQLLRARVLALNLCAILALYGHHEGMAELEREALDGLERALA